MAATVGELVVNLVARTAKFVKGMERGRRETSKFGAAAAMASKQMAKFIGPLAGAVGIIKVVGALRNAAASIDRLAKTSRKLGLVVGELVALRHAAELAGVGANTLDMAMQRMTRRVSEAAHDTGEAQAAIKELGLDAKKLATAGPYKALLDIADAMQRTGSASNQLRLAFKLFDSEGAALVNMLRGGSAELERIRRETDKLAMSSAIGAKVVEDMNDAFTRLNLIITDTAWNQLTIAIAGIGSELGLWGTPLAETIVALKQSEANARGLHAEMANATAEMEKMAKLSAEAKTRFDNIYTAQPKAARDLSERWQAEWRQQGMGPRQKQIAQWREGAERAGLPPGNIDSIVGGLERLATLLGAGDARRARSANIRSILGGVLGDAGGDGAYSLSGAAAKGSAAAYSAIVNRGLGSAKERTEKEILAIARKRLRIAEETEKRIEELTRKLVAEEDVERVIL